MTHVSSLLALAVIAHLAASCNGAPVGTEARAGADTIRHASDSAAVRLQLVPPFARPAAAYAVGPVVLLAAYDPCPPGFREPLIRYLRRDQADHVQTDVMLQRSAAAP